MKRRCLKFQKKNSFEIYVAADLDASTQNRSCVEVIERLWGRRDLAAVFPNTCYIMFVPVRGFQDHDAFVVAGLREGADSVAQHWIRLARDEDVMDRRQPGRRLKHSALMFGPLVDANAAVQMHNLAIDGITD